jgi:signal-transduction protein with cAMP-binding, CBS, and nucleotidyltransferase domain
MTSQTDVFRRVVGDHMAPPPLVVAADASCASVVRALTEARSTAAVVVAPNGALLGIVTEQDVARRIACRDVAGQPIAGFMTSPVRTVDVAAPLYTAIGLMRRCRLRHMPAVGPDGQTVGMLDLHEALAVGPLAADIDRLTHEDTLAGLAGVKAAQVQLAADLMADNVPAPEVQSLISEINNDIYRRVLTLLVAEMAREGRGPPPVPFATIVMGSGGRGESYLCPDQDNGFILADYPDADHAGIDPWFIELAQRMTGTLEGLHFPLCRSGVMATSPIWRKTLSQWRAQIAGWLRHRREPMLQCCALLVDFRPVHGTVDLAHDLRR